MIFIYPFQLDNELQWHYSYLVIGIDIWYDKLKKGEQEEDYYDPPIQINPQLDN
jgi:hypothetical protein